MNQTHNRMTSRHRREKVSLFFISEEKELDLVNDNLVTKGLLSSHHCIDYLFQKLSASDWKFHKVTQRLLKGFWGNTNCLFQRLYVKDGGFHNPQSQR